jgi:hypothetical protein
MCDAMIGGELNHSCSHGPPPHRIKVALLKGANRKVWKEIQAVLDKP